MLMAAFMMLLSPAAFADENKGPTPEEMKAELEKLAKKGGKAAEVAKDFLSSDCANQLATAHKRNVKNIKASKNACKDIKKCKKRCNNKAKKTR